MNLEDMEHLNNAKDGLIDFIQTSNITHYVLLCYTEEINEDGEECQSLEIRCEEDNREKIIATLTDALESIRN